MMLLFVFQKFAVEPLACGSCCHSNFEFFEVFSSVEEVKQVTVFVYYMYPHFQSESWISFLSFENDFSFTPK